MVQYRLSLGMDGHLTLKEGGLYMTESIKAGIKAINKWVFFGWNYSCVHHEWISFNGEKKCEAVPQFLVEVKWTCNFDHMYQKWSIAIRDTDPNSYLVKFYAELDDSNRELLLVWVMEHYNDEKKIFHEESEECSEAQTLAKIREWAEDTPYGLSNREGYPRGYREGMIRAHQIAMSIITGEPLND